mmetsp:Transcript_9441/g.23982  ORF Transcript_9441/g.23982 Transcript_9441/m.23982 type:complete len:270 (-) Transcript_9441:454-1263(-)
MFCSDRNISVVAVMSGRLPSRGRKPPPDDWSTKRLTAHASCQKFSSAVAAADAGGADVVATSARACAYVVAPLGTYPTHGATSRSSAPPATGLAAARIATADACESTLAAAEGTSGCVQARYAFESASLKLSGKSCPTSTYDEPQARSVSRKARFSGPVVGTCVSGAGGCCASLQSWRCLRSSTTHGTCRLSTSSIALKSYAAACAISSGHGLAMRRSATELSGFASSTVCSAKLRRTVPANPTHVDKMSGTPCVRHTSSSTAATASAS